MLSLFPVYLRVHHYKNKGVKINFLDAVIDYLPAPTDVEAS